MPLHNTFVLERRQSDITDEVKFGVALLINDAFAGWVAKVNLDAVEAQLEVEGGATGRIIELHKMPWRKGGGKCLRGLVKVNAAILAL